MVRPIYLHLTQSSAYRLGKLRDAWANCQKCDLCKIRHKMVYVRGHVPASVAFIGEAPGESENIVGYPFVGQSGNLLNELITKVVEETGIEFTYAVMNLVACFPGKDDYGNFNKPHRNAIKTCEPRLRSLLELVNPKLVVTLGEVAHKKLPDDLKVSQPYLALAHPSNISRTKDPNEYTLKYRRFILCLSEAIREHLS